MTDPRASSKTGLLLAVELDGAGGSLRESVRRAEAAGFALATFDDEPGRADAGSARPRLEAGTRAAYAAALTHRIGLAPTLHVATTEPFHTATQLASLDRASHGRAAWVVGSAADEAALATVGEGPRSADQLRRELADAVEAARRLWDSWEDDAVIKDVATGRFVDADRVHHIDFAGATFAIKGPLITPRPPQGQVVVIAEAALGLGALADVVLVDGSDPERVAGAEGAIVLADLRSPVGSVGELVAQVRALAGYAAGVRLTPAALGLDLSVLADEVVPALGDLVRRPAAAARLRDTLGLPRPANRYATAR